MAEDSLITGKLKSRIGVEWEPKVYEIEKGMIQRFVQAIGDPNPLWQDEEYAGKSKHGGIIAPPTFAPVIGYDWIQQERTALLPPVGILHGSTELECYQPIRAGDTITVTTRIEDVREREGRKIGRMIVVTLDTTYKNQRQEMVARCKRVSIGYKIEGVKYD